MVAPYVRVVIYRIRCYELCKYSQEECMAINLRASVRGEIIRLRRSIARTSSQLASLKGELRSRQKIYLLLGGEGVRKQRVRRRGRKRATVDWNSVLKILPSPLSPVRLSSTLNAPQPELGAEGRTQRSSRRSPQREPWPHKSYSIYLPRRSRSFLT